MGGVIQAQRPVGLALTAPLIPTGVCGPSFDVTTLRVALDYQGATVFRQTFGVPFRFEP
jgi:hypothetical protein